MLTARGRRVVLPQARDRQTTRVILMRKILMDIELLLAPLGPVEGPIEGAGEGLLLILLILPLEGEGEAGEEEVVEEGDPLVEGDPQEGDVAEVQQL